MAKILLTGIGASNGKSEGIARLLYSGNIPSSFQEGDILVAPITDPTMIQAMIKAAAIVTDIGGITSHPAILSREMGIPCVVNTKNATQKIKNGMRIRVDGTKGKIFLISCN